MDDLRRFVDAWFQPGVMGGNPQFILPDGMTAKLSTSV
jgi:hypothetical protein